ncbi:hypothetical protein BGZ83_006833 [Gryganskiella cystojenkinii]|nr:hypothetical protein BGZ83_006833 [Gryganskiella cystojenkinii]
MDSSTLPPKQPPVQGEEMLEYERVEHDAAPPLSEIDAPTQQIPGQERLEKAVGKAVGGTIIPSDMKPSEMPTTTKLDAEKKEVPLERQPQAQPQVLAKTQTDANPSSSKENKSPKDQTVGAYPTMTRIGWLEAYKRTDGPQNEFRGKSIWMEEFASSTLFGAFWQNAAAMLVIPVVCYVVFKLGGGFISLVWIIAFGATYYKNSIRRFRRNARDDIARELIRNSLEDGTESVEWINNFMTKFWVIYEPVLSSTIVQTVDSILLDSTPAVLDSLRLTSFTLGTKAPRVESIKSYPKSESDIVLMDWRVNFTPTDIEDMTPRQLRSQVNPKIVLTVRVGKGFVGAGMPILVEDVSFRGYLRLKLKLTSNFPHIKTLDLCFLEPPTIDYVLKPVGGETFGIDIAHIPGLQSFIRDQTHAILGPMMYAPNVYTLDLEQMMTGGASLTAAVGVVQFTIYNAKDLKNAELVGSSDPYIKLRLGNRPEMASTAVQQNTLNPVWNETNIILVNSLNEIVCMEVMDKDNLRKDSSLGQANFDLKSLEEEPVQDDIWCKVLSNGKERGGVRVRAAFFPVQKPQLSADGGEAVPVESNSGILAINLAQAKDVARTGSTKSHCQVSLNGRVVHTTKRTIGSNPNWGADVDVFITDLEAAQINVEVVSGGHILGSYGVAATKLLEDSVKKVDWASLQGGQGTGKLKMTAVWKPILMDADLNPSEHKPAFGVARIQLFGGRSLRNVEIGSSSDPYVVVSGDKGISHGRTKTIENNLNPVWDEIHYVPVNSMKQTFKLETFDFQKVTKDRTLGWTTFDMSEIVEELADKKGYAARSPIERWSALKQKDGSTKGELHYKIAFFPSLKLAQDSTTNDAKDDTNQTKDLAAHPDERLSKNQSQDRDNDKDLVANKIMHNAAATTLPPGTIPAHEALDYDSGILVTQLISANIVRAKTYCEFYIDSDSYQFKSQVQRSRNPKWNETADIFVKELEYAKLNVVVKEKSSMEKDPIVGIFSSNVRSLLESTPKDGKDFELLDKGGQRGTIRMKFEYLPVRIDLLPKERLDNMGTMTVNLLRAKNLIAVDRGGASDPYFVFFVNGKEVYKSEVIKKTLNPEYNETFAVPITSRAEDKFSFDVFDWNQLQSAKSLGAGAIDLREIQLVLPNDYQIPLQNKHNQGEVQMRIKFIPEFLSANKRKSGLGATFLGNGVGLVAHGGHAIGSAGVAGVGAVVGGVGAVGQGAMDATGAVGKGALKGVGHIGKGVGTVGKGVFSGLSAGASAVGLHNREEKQSAAQPPPDTASVPHGIAPPNSVVAPSTSREQDGSVQSELAGNSSEVMSGEPGTLTIHVLEADGLLGVDKNGMSDPYVKVRVNGQTVLKTKTKKETLSPSWSESVQVPGLSGETAVMLDFAVRDHNTIGSDKDLADCDISLWEYIHPGAANQPQQHHADFWAPLGESGGRLHLALEFEPTPRGTEGNDKHEGKRGFGKALAERLVGKGAKVILGDIDVKDGERLATELNYGRHDKIAYFVQCDVTKYDQQAALFQAAQKYFGRVDIIVNNAGIAENTPLWTDDKGLWKKVIDIDLLAVVEGTRQGIEVLQKQGTGGVIINTASLAGLYPQPLTPAYCAAKFGVVGLTRSFKDFRDNIRVNAVAPSFADTKIIANVREIVAEIAPLVPVELVIDAFMLLIEDDSYSGDVARITPKYGISVIGRTTRNSKEEKAKL